MSNYSSMSTRIKKAVTMKDLCSLDKSLSRVYNVGALSTSEFMRLDGMILDRQIKLEVA
tara:strand:+ start:432 stop:608 length:177 start_codon:yes stop_codon:yes gene_type:complete